MPISLEQLEKCLNEEKSLHELFPMPVPFDVASFERLIKRFSNNDNNRTRLLNAEELAELCLFLAKETKDNIRYSVNLKIVINSLQQPIRYLRLLKSRELSVEISTLHKLMDLTAEQASVFYSLVLSAPDKLSLALLIKYNRLLHYPNFTAVIFAYESIFKKDPKLAQYLFDHLLVAKNPVEYAAVLSGGKAPTEEDIVRLRSIQFPLARLQIELFYKRAKLPIPQHCVDRLDALDNEKIIHYIKCFERINSILTKPEVYYDAILRQNDPENLAEALVLITDKTCDYMDDVFTAEDSVAYLKARNIISRKGLLTDEINSGKLKSDLFCKSFASLSEDYPTIVIRTILSSRVPAALSSQVAECGAEAFKFHEYVDCLQTDNPLAALQQLQRDVSVATKVDDPKSLAKKLICANVVRAKLAAAVIPKLYHQDEAYNKYVANELYAATKNGTLNEDFVKSFIQVNTATYLKFKHLDEPYRELFAKIVERAEDAHLPYTIDSIHLDGDKANLKLMHAVSKDIAIVVLPLSITLNPSVINLILCSGQPARTTKLLLRLSAAGYMPDDLLVDLQKKPQRLENVCRAVAALEGAGVVGKETVPLVVSSQSPIELGNELLQLLSRHMAAYKEIVSECSLHPSLLSYVKALNLLTENLTAAELKLFREGLKTNISCADPLAFAGKLCDFKKQYRQFFDAYYSCLVAQDWDKSSVFLENALGALGELQSGNKLNVRVRERLTAIGYTPALYSLCSVLCGRETSKLISISEKDLMWLIDFVFKAIGRKELTDYYLSVFNQALTDGSGIEGSTRLMHQVMELSSRISELGIYAGTFRDEPIVVVDDYHPMAQQCKNLV